MIRKNSSTEPQQHRSSSIEPDWERFSETLTQRLCDAEGCSREPSHADRAGGLQTSATPNCERASEDWSAQPDSDLNAAEFRNEDCVLRERAQRVAAKYIHPAAHLFSIRLAAAFGSETAFKNQVLAPNAITVLAGIHPSELNRAKRQIEQLLLPAEWVAHSRAPLHPPGPVLQICQPELRASGSITSSSLTTFEDNIRDALAFPHPLLVLLPDGVQLSSPLRRLLPVAIRLRPFGRQILQILLAQRYCPAGGFDHQAIGPLLPTDETLATLEFPFLLVALRQPSARDAALKLTELTKPAARPARHMMSLEEIGGQSPAHQAAAAIVSDLKAWQDGTVQWLEITRSLLFSGEPGVGKTVLANAIAKSACVPLLEASFGRWQSEGHLGDMLGAMCKSFSEAVSARPCVFFIDELDAAGARDSRDQNNSNYRRQVINAFLKEIDQLHQHEGVILLGACNSPGTLDPAILRPGRFDAHHELPRPLISQISHMLRQEFSSEEGVQALAKLFAGQTPAGIDAQIRAAKSKARKDGKPFNAASLAAQLGSTRLVRSGLERRIAIHECGHAVAATLLGAGPVERIAVAADGGMTTRKSAIIEGTAGEFENELSIHMAGRAAERLILGSISAGSGGSRDSDLALATCLQLYLDRQTGLGIHGPIWLGEPDLLRLSPEDRDSVSARLSQFEDRARMLLEPHRELIEHLSGLLAEARELGAEDLCPWLGPLTGS